VDGDRAAALSPPVHRATAPRAGAPPVRRAPPPPSAPRPPVRGAQALDDAAPGAESRLKATSHPVAIRRLPRHLAHGGGVDIAVIGALADGREASPSRPWAQGPCSLRSCSPLLPSCSLLLVRRHLGGRRARLGGGRRRGCALAGTAAWRGCSGRCAGSRPLSSSTAPHGLGGLSPRGWRGRRGWWPRSSARGCETAARARRGGARCSSPASARHRGDSRAFSGGDPPGG
jgi:hypothetical protein